LRKSSFFRKIGRLIENLFFPYYVEPYIAVPLNIEHYITASGNTMTRIYFVITSGSSTILGSNIEPFTSINEILNTISHRSYHQCVPYISFNMLLPLKLCVPVNEIPRWSNLITKAVSAATGTGQSNVNVMLKGVQEGVTPIGYVMNWFIG
jgi:hypothetical protein